MKNISRRKFFGDALALSVVAPPTLAALAPAPVSDPVPDLCPRWIGHRDGWHTLTWVMPSCIEVGVELCQDPPDDRGRRRWTCRMNGHGQDLGVCTVATAKRKAEEWAVKMLASVITAIQGTHRPNGLKELL